MASRDIVFVLPRELDWWPVLAQHGKVVDRLEDDLEDDEGIVIPFHAARCARRTFAPPPVLYEKLNRVSAFVAFMARGFSALLPKQLIEPYPYPCVVKQQYSFAGCGVQIAQSADDLPIAYACVQEPIYGGVEYVEHAVVLAGVVRARVRFRVQLAGDLVVKQGRLVGEEVASDPFLDPVFAQLGYTGFACANFKLVDRQPKIFEINPRMGGSLVFSDRLGDMLDCVRGLFA